MYKTVTDGEVKRYGEGEDEREREMGGGEGCVSSYDHLQLALRSTEPEGLFPSPVAPDRERGEREREQRETGEERGEEREGGGRRESGGSFNVSRTQSNVVKHNEAVAIFVTSSNTTAICVYMKKTRMCNVISDQYFPQHMPRRDPTTVCVIRGVATTGRK